MVRPEPEQIRAWIEANFDYKTRKGGSELVICNPFNGDTGFHFNISINKANCHDWRGDDWAGNFKPTFLRFVQLYRNCSFTQAVKEVCGGSVNLNSLRNELRKQRQQVDTEAKEREDVGISLPVGSQPILESSQPKMAAILINWLNARGVDLEHIKLYNLHHCADHVVWPYYEYDALVYWQSRSRFNKFFLFPDESVGVTKGMFIYGFDMIEPSDYMILTEAIFGSHTLREQCGASGGAVLTELQVRKIRVLNPVRGVILGPDNDSAGLRSIAHNYHMLSPYYPVLYSVPPKLKYTGPDGEEKFTKDWNEIGQYVTGFKEVRSIFDKGVKRATMADIVKFSRV